MAEWVEKGSLKGPPGEIPDVSDFLRDSDVSPSISGSSDKVASDKAVKDYVDSQVSAEATARQELEEEVDGKANAEHTHEISDVTGLNDKIFEIETSVAGKANSSHEHGAQDITSGVLSADRIPNITDDKIVGMSADKLTGTIPTENLPSYVDDVVEYEKLESFPEDGESGKIYVDTTTNKTYRWSGTNYVEISASLALGETSSTAYRGDYGAAAHAHAVNKGSKFDSGLYKFATNDEGHVSSAVAITKEDITSLGIPAQDTTYVDATTEVSGLMSAADKTKLDGMDSAISDAVASEASERENADEALQTNIDKKADIGHTHTIENVTDLQTALDSKAASVHSHATSDITGLDTALSGKADAGHKHTSDDITDFEDKLSTKANVSHTHTTSQIDGLDAKISGIESDISGKADVEHMHDIEDINGLDGALTTISLVTWTSDDIQ